MKFKFLSNSKFECVTLNELLRRFFYSYAFYLCRYRWLFLIVPLIFTGLGSTGLYFLKRQTRNDTYYAFTPINSQSDYERAVLNEHWPVVQGKYFPGKYYEMSTPRAEVLVQAKNGGNLLDFLNATIELNNQILENLTVPSFDGLLNVTYSLVCLKWDDDCYQNDHLQLLQRSDELARFVTPVTYPVSRKGDAPFYLGSTVGGVKLGRGNATGRIDYVHSLRMTYSMVDSPHPWNIYSRQWMLRLQDFILSYQSPDLNLAINHVETLIQGLEENAKRLVPKFSITVLVLVFFCILCSFVLLEGDEEKSRGKVNFLWNCLSSVDWIRSKPGLAMIGILSSCMSISTAMGIMLFAGSEFNSVVCVMPFLVLSIGVNDMCIMTTAWHRTSITTPVPQRLAETLSEAAVAITITSFTDVISFSIGSWNSLPAVIMFCSYAAVALLLEYIYQITFYSAALTFYGNFEASGKHCMAPCLNAKPSNQKDLNWFQKLFMRGAVIPKASSTTKPKVERAPSSNFDQPEKETAIMRFFRVTYAPAILHPLGRLVVIAGYGVYIGFAFWGCTHIREGLQFSNLVHRQHYMIRYIHMLPDFWHEGMQVQIVINQPPNLTDATERGKLLTMAHRFENSSHTMQSNATMFFLYEYLNYLDQMDVALENTTQLWYVELRRWLRHTGSSATWETDMLWDENDQYRLLAFRFQVGLRDFDTGEKHTEAATYIRQVASEYPEYNVTTFHEYWPFVDQYMMIRPNMIQDNVIAVISMVLISIILIPNLACGVFITLAMLSINIGVYGYMTWWSVDLDCISMITLIMALGFAIDYSAHICSAYVSAEGMSTSRRTVAALETLGWPIFQGALTTIFGTLTLATVDGYMVQTFFKTVLLTILFGLSHSIVFLPVALSLFLPENGIQIGKRCKAFLNVFSLRSKAVKIDNTHRTVDESKI